MLRVLILVSLIWLVGSCDDVPTAPLPGRLDIRLESPHQDDGAILFVVSGAEIDSVEPAGFPVYQAALTTSSRRVIVAGALAPGLVAHLWVPDIHAVRRYHATLEQVAQLGTFAIRDTAGYTVRVVTAPAVP